jgi:lysophospholipase L1-like esterase
MGNGCEPFEVTYQFHIVAQVRMGEAIGLCGSIPELGSWDPGRCLRLVGGGDGSLDWSGEVRIAPATISLDRMASESVSPNAMMPDGPGERMEYKYVRLGRDGSVRWEAPGPNRWAPVEAGPPGSTIIINDGVFGEIQAWPYGIFAEFPPEEKPGDSGNRKVAVIGSSVAAGFNAWLVRGWAWRLREALRALGIDLANVSEPGANVVRTIQRFPEVVPPERPDVVVIGLSLGNEGLANCGPGEGRPVQKGFEEGLLRLVRMTEDLGATPVLGGVYPNGNYSLEHYELLRETRERMLSWGIPVLDWLSALDDGAGKWKPGIWFDPGHPNSEGHRLMFEAIDLGLFG